MNFNMDKRKNSLEKSSGLQWENKSYLLLARLLTIYSAADNEYPSSVPLLLTKWPLRPSSVTFSKCLGKEFTDKIDFC